MPGKLANVLKEMKRKRVGIMGVAETFWNKEGSFPTQLPESEGGDKYQVFYSGGKKKRRGGDCKGRGGKVCNDVGADLGENYDNEIKGGSDKYADCADICTL